MGHMINNDIYRKLGKKIDNMRCRVPWNESLYNILKELYTIEEAEVVVKMPYAFSNLDKIARLTKYEKFKLHSIIDKLCSKGLVVDLWINGEYQYIPSPLVIGIFEFTMMRTGENLNCKEWGKLFHEYMQSGSVYDANFKNGEKIFVSRVLPYEESVEISDYTEIIDYEKAASIIEDSDKLAIGICSCRHEKLHAEAKKCDTPLNTCSTFGIMAEFLIRHNMAKEVSKEEMYDNLARSKELGLVLEAENVKKNISFICHCCGCCCNLLLGINQFGYSNTIVTSNYIASIDEDKCVGCEQCAKACHINAIEMISVSSLNSKNKKKPKIDTSICLGCGVCHLKCTTGAIQLIRRKKKVLYPETTFERIILQSLERGTLQNLIFDNPNSKPQQIMCSLLGAFLKALPVKKTFMSNIFRSTFLNSFEAVAKITGKEWLMTI